MDTYPYAENQHHNSIQSCDIAHLTLQIPKLLLACPGVPDHTLTNGPNHIDVFMYA